MPSTEQSWENQRVGSGINGNARTPHSTNNGINGTESKETHEKLENFDNLEKHRLPITRNRFQRQMRF